MTLQERFRGCLLGLACGDAVGTTVEFRQPGSFKPVRDMGGGGPFGLKPGQWTDDTSMALCLAASLVEKRGFDPLDQLERYVKWAQAGYFSSTGHCFDIGNTVKGALRRYLEIDKQLPESPSPYFGATDPGTAGNGSLMRLAPVPLFYHADPLRAIAMAANSSRTTHGAKSAVDGCRYLAGLIVGALQGASREELTSPRYAPIPGCWDNDGFVPEIDEVARGSFKQRQPPEIQGTGYAVRSLEAALWAFDRSSSFSEGCLLAVNLGHDADTTAAIFGQIAGAFYGEPGIPEPWLAKLFMRQEITALADQVLELSGSA